MAVFLLSWVVGPLLLLVMALGSGLLVGAGAERTGTPRADPFPGVLVVPVGFALVVVVSSLLTNWKTTAPLAGVGPLAIAIVGLVIGRHRLVGFARGWRAIGWPLVASLLPGGAIAAPVVLTGHASVTGYTKITDLGHQLAFIEYLRTDGRAPMPEPATTSSFDQVIAKLVDAYPGGSQSVVASMGDLTHTPITWTYQPLLAFVGAMLGLALFVVLRRAIPSPGWRALAAGVAAQPTILYAYALAAGIKEISGAAAIALFVAVIAERRPMSWSPLIPAAAAIASGYAVFSVTIFPWIGVMFLVFAVYELLAERRQWLSTALRWAGIWGLAAVMTFPFVKDGVELLKATGATGPVGLGNLAAPVPAWSAVGPWITADHRFPLKVYGEPKLTYALIAVALVLVVIAVVKAFLMRDRAMVAIAVGCAVAMTYILRNSEVWVQLKAFCMTAPFTLSLAFSGAAWLVGAGRAWRPLRTVRVPIALAGLWAGALVAGGVLYGNALQYRHTPMVPYARMAELERIDKQFTGQGPALLPDFDEFAEYILRGARASGLVDPWRGILYNRTARPGLQTDRDTDEFDQVFLQRYPLIIRRRDPTTSRPPSDYKLVASYRWYEVWKRVGDPRLIEAHYPLHSRPKERTRQFCARVQQSIDKAGPGAQIRWAIAPPDVTAIIPKPQSVPATWKLDPATGDIRAGAPGRLQQGFAIKNAGRYHVFLRGSVGRRVTVTIDNHVVGSLRWRESYQGHYEQLADVVLRGRDHVLGVVRPGGDLLPGTGNDASGATTLLGPVVLEPVNERTVMRTAPASRLRSVCRSNVRMDWLEVIRRVPR